MNELYNSTVNGTAVSKVQVFEQHLEVQREGLVLDGNNTYPDLNVSTALDESINAIYEILDYDRSKMKIEEYSPTEFDVKISFDPRAGKNFIKWSGAHMQASEQGVIEVWNYDADEFTAVSYTHLTLPTICSV